MPQFEIPKTRQVCIRGRLTAMMLIGRLLPRLLLIWPILIPIRQVNRHGRISIRGLDRLDREPGGCAATACIAGVGAFTFGPGDGPRAGRGGAGGPRQSRTNH